MLVLLAPALKCSGTGVGESSDTITTPGAPTSVFFALVSTVGVPDSDGCLSAGVFAFLASDFF